MTGVTGQMEASSGMGPARITALAVGLVTAALVALFAFGGGGSSDDGVGSLLGTRTPPVEGPLLLGEGSYDIDDHRGSWVLVNFFATWCPPCVAEHPELVELERWGAERGDLTLVSVVFNDSAELVAEFFAQRGGSWPVIDDPTASVGFKVSQVPESFLVAPSGQVVFHVKGQVTAADVQDLIEERA